MEKLRVGVAMCGSFCTFDTALAAFEQLAATGRYVLTPILSETAHDTDSRFGDAAGFIARMEAPCTGNTLAKLANGVTDTAVTMAAKSHLRIGRPVVLAVSTNDGLSGSAQNIGALLQRKNVYLVPFRQDDPEKKPFSLVADFSRLEDALLAAVGGRQLQPVLMP